MNIFVSWALLIVPWLSLFFLNKNSIKRYMPAAIFVSLLLALISELAFTYDWWVIETSVFPPLITDVSIVFGTFLVGTIWVLHFTYGDFWKYMMVNLILDFALMWIIASQWERIGIYRLVNITRLQVFLLATMEAVLLYAYLRWQATIYEKRPEDKVETTDNSLYSRWFGKEKAR